MRLSEDTLLYVGKYEGEIKDNVPNGKGTFFTLQNEKYVTFFVDGLPHGQYVKYDDSANVLESGLYDKGRRTGVITYYFGNEFVGGIRGQIPYANDKVTDGPTTVTEVNYSTGVLKRTFVGKYENGVRSGEWRDAITIRIKRHSPIILMNDLFATNELSLEQIDERNRILISLSDAKISVYDETGYYISSTADVSPNFLDKILPIELKKYIPKLSAALTRYQKPYTATWVTTGKEAYVILNNSQVTYASYDVEKDQLYGEAISTFLNGDSYSGKLDSAGSNFEGVVTLMLADGSKLIGPFSQADGCISGKAKYTFKDPSINDKEVTKDVTVINGEWKYQTKAQEDFSKTSKRISRAWKDIFHNGNVFDKFANIGIHSLNIAAYPFAWAMMKYEIDTIGVSYSTDKGFGIIISKDGIGDWNLTISDLMQIAVLIEDKGEEKAAMRFKFKASMIIDNPNLYSYAIDSNVKHKKDKTRPPLKKAIISPVASRQGAYFSSMNRISPDEAYEQFFNQRLLGEYDWTPYQKETLASTLFDEESFKVTTDKLVKQMEDETLGLVLKNFISPKMINSKMRSFGTDIQVTLMVECINWAINRWKTHDLDPNIRFKIYALMAVTKYTYDRTIWAQWFNSDKSPQFSGREQVIFSEALRAMKEFEEDLTRTGKNRNEYKVPQIPFKY